MLQLLMAEQMSGRASQVALALSSAAAPGPPPSAPSCSHKLPTGRSRQTRSEEGMKLSGDTKQKGKNPQPFSVANSGAFLQNTWKFPFQVANRHFCLSLLALLNF